MPLAFGAQGVTPSLRQLATNNYILQSGEAWIIPAGLWGIQLGNNLKIQQFDPTSGLWLGGAGDQFRYGTVQSDGVNFRVCNPFGSIVAATVTNRGTGYTSAPTVTANAGNATFAAILGYYLSSISVTNGGTNYTYPPLIAIGLPPNPGYGASAYSTLTSGAVSAITLVDSGAGYTSIPQVSIINDPRDTTGANAQATAVLSAIGTVTGVVPVVTGSGYTSVPTLAFSGGGGSSAAATAILPLKVDTVSFGGTNTGYTVSTFVEVRIINTILPTSNNGRYETGQVSPRAASIACPTNGSGVVSATGAIYNDRGVIINTGVGVVADGKTVFTAGLTVTPAYSATAVDSFLIWGA